MHWWYLGLAILFEVLATSALKLAAGFSRVLPSLLVVAGYALAFYFLSLSLRSIPLGIAYGLWSAIGIAVVSVVGWLVYGERLDAAALVGLGLIIAGIAVIHGLSRSVPP